MAMLLLFFCLFCKKELAIPTVAGLYSQRPSVLLSVRVPGDTRVVPSDSRAGARPVGVTPPHSAP